MIPLTQVTWEHISNYGKERRGRKTKTIYLNASHIFKLEEEEHGTRICYSANGNCTVEESPQQISQLMLRVNQIRNDPYTREFPDVRACEVWLEYEDGTKCNVDAHLNMDESIEAQIRESFEAPNLEEGFKLINFKWKELGI